MNGYDPNDNAEDAAEQEDGVGPRRRKKSLKEERKKRTGANKGRRFGKVRDELELCWKIATGVTCEFGDKFVSLSSLPCFFPYVRKAVVTLTTSKHISVKSQKTSNFLQKMLFAFHSFQKHRMVLVTTKSLLLQ